MKKIWAALLAAVCGAGALGGCAPGTVDYVENSEQAGSTVSALEQQFADSKWEDLVVMSWNGTTVSVEIDVSVEVPDVDAMAAVEVKRFAMDEAGKESFLEGMFGEEIYYFEDAAYRKAEDVEALISVAQGWLEAAQANIDRWSDSYKENDPDAYDELFADYQKYEDMIAYYKQLMETAPDSYTRAETFSEDVYLGIRDGVEYLVRFDGESADYSYVSIEPKETSDSVQIGNFLHNKTEGRTGLSEIEGLSPEAAREQVNAFLTAAGFSWYVETGMEGVSWQYSETNDTYYSYKFTFEPGTDGVGFTSLRPDNTARASRYSDEALLTVYVTPGSGISAHWENPVEFVSKTDEVMLLSFDNLKTVLVGAVESALMFSPAEGTEVESLCMTSLKLGYIRLWDGETEDSYTYVPMWKFSNSFYDPVSYKLYVNAIDGSVIDTSVEY